MKWISITCLGFLTVAFFACQNESSSNGTGKYRTAKLDRGNLSITVTATGTLQAVTTVQVGTQVSGVISKLNVDFNDRVEEGQIVAELDRDLLQARLTQDRASLSRSEANLSKLEVERADAARNLERQKELFEKKIASQTDLDGADLRVQNAIAQIQIAKAELDQARSAVSMSEINLAHATIRSPISGIVISRSVDVGQTVAASLSAPTLFTIANDLSKMWVLANIDEADIGQIQTAQKATFTVDSFPDRDFEARVRQVRLQPTTIQNVVMYTVVLDVDNPNGLLLPGLTANLSILVDRAENALRVPNAALRFEAPEESQASASTATPKTGGERAMPSNGGNRRSAKDDGGEAKPGKPGRVYLWQNEQLHPVKIRIGRSDGAFTEILSGDVKEGDEIVLGQQIEKNSNSMPRSPWGRR